MNVFKKLNALILFFPLLLASGCATVVEDVNKGAKEVGKAGGGVMRLPGSVSEGVSEGVAGEPESNPYNR